MDSYGYILYLNKKIIGVYNNEQLLNIFIDGAIQKSYFNREDIIIDKYIMNSMVLVAPSNSDSLEIEQLEKERVEKERLEKEQLEKLEKDRLDKERQEKVEKEKQLLESSEFALLMQNKIDTKNQLNRLKHTKKKYEEELSQYKYDI